MSKARISKGKQWARKQAADPYVRAAQQQGYRSRAAYKLLAIARSHALFRRGAAVVDLGAAPGGWSQVAAKQVGQGGCVVAVDLLEMPPLANVHFIRGDFCGVKVQEAIRAALPPPHHADVIISDMSPNISGIKITDDENTYQLNAAALTFAQEILTTNGALLIKSFEGAATQQILPALRTTFEQVKIIKPDASRKHSREVYLYAFGKTQ